MIATTVNTVLYSEKYCLDLYYLYYFACKLSFGKLSVDNLKIDQISERAGDT
jgi:hypothetical protein